MMQTPNSSSYSYFTYWVIRTSVKLPCDQLQLFKNITVYSFSLYKLYKIQLLFVTSHSTKYYYLLLLTIQNITISYLFSFLFVEHQENKSKYNKRDYYQYNHDSPTSRCWNQIHNENNMYHILSKSVSVTEFDKVQNNALASAPEYAVPRVWRDKAGLMGSIFMLGKKPTKRVLVILEF